MSPNMPVINLNLVQFGGGGGGKGFCRLFTEFRLFAKNYNKT
jgi:hypothetical protein